MPFTEYAPLIDTGLIVALALIVWAAYRELRSRNAAHNRFTSQNTYK